MAFAVGSLVKVTRGTKNSNLLPVGTVARVAVAVPAYSVQDHKGQVPNAGVILDNGQYPYVWNESRFQAYTPDPVNYATPSPGSPFSQSEGDSTGESSCDDC